MSGAGTFAQRVAVPAQSIFAVDPGFQVMRTWQNNVQMEHAFRRDMTFSANYMFAKGYNLPVVTKDALAGKHGEFDMVLANPPFGKKSSVTIVNEAGEQSKESLVINRDDFWASTSNKQLNFLQHIFTILKQHGRAAGREDRGAPGQDRRLENLARVNQQSVERPLGDPLQADQSAAGVEQQYLKNLHFVGPVFLAQQVGHARGAADREPAVTSEARLTESLPTAVGVARADLHVMAALGADVQVPLHLGLVDDLEARVALDPHPLGDLDLLAVFEPPVGHGGEKVQFLACLMHEHVAEHDRVVAGARDVRVHHFGNGAAIQVRPLSRLKITRSPPRP